MVKVHWDLGYLPNFIFHKGLANEDNDYWPGKRGLGDCIVNPLDSVPA